MVTSIFKISIIRNRMLIRTKIRGKEVTRSIIRGRLTTEMLTELAEGAIKITIRVNHLTSSSSSLDQEIVMSTITDTIQVTVVTVVMGATSDAGIELLNVYCYLN